MKWSALHVSETASSLGMLHGMRDRQKRTKQTKQTKDKKQYRTFGIWLGIEEVSDLLVNRNLLGDDLWEVEPNLHIGILIKGQERVVTKT